MSLSRDGTCGEYAVGRARLAPAWHPICRCHELTRHPTLEGRGQLEDLPAAVAPSAGPVPVTEAACAPIPGPPGPDEGEVRDRLAGAHPPRAERGPLLWRREPGQERHELLPD